MTVRPASKFTPTMARGGLRTLVRSSAPNAKSLVIFFNKCPNGTKIGKTHANVGTEETSDDDMGGLMSTLEIDIDADYFFEGFDMVTIGSKKRYL